jgi:hypothetical protein
MNDSGSVAGARLKPMMLVDNAPVPVRPVFAADEWMLICKMGGI